MKKLAPLAILAGALAGCPNGPSNPSQLWLNYNVDELHIKLQDAEPNPF
jgi:hypothetical protein